MPNSRALVKHIEAINAQSRAWVAEDPSNRIAGEIVTIPDHWADYGVYTPEEFDRYLLEEDYVGLYKDVWGIRYRGDLSTVSNAELKALIDSMYTRLEAEMEDQREYFAEIEADEAEYKAGLAHSIQFEKELEEASSKWDDLQEVFDASATIKKILH